MVKKKNAKKSSQVKSKKELTTTECLKQFESEFCNDIYGHVFYSYGPEGESPNEVA